MARGAFSTPEVQKSLQLYIPVIVDGDVEKDAMSKYGVRGYPTVKFVSSKGEEHAGFSGVSSGGAVIAKGNGALKAMGPIRLTKAFKKLLKARAGLDKAMAKKKTKGIIKAILDIEKIKHKGADLEFAVKEKNRLIAKATKQVDEAKGLMESRPKKAKNILKRVSKDYAGLEIAAEAKKLAASIEA